ncbi:hypothetical protein AMECASPLE_004175 [Ameca splendens]|uniref:Uncharacterized protein n=1 Tax=Ameca splendens TaxID=208324 RepID=A0ABV0ZV05_9TELE
MFIADETQMHTFHSHHLFQQVQSSRCLQFHVRESLSTHTLSHCETCMQKRELVHSLNHLYSRSITAQTVNVTIRVCQTQSRSGENRKKMCKMLDFSFQTEWKL